MGADHDLGDFLLGNHLSRRANQVLLTAVLQVARSHVGVVFDQRFQDIAEGDIERHQFFRVGRHLVLLDISADTVDFRHAGNRAELGPDDPVLNRAQRHHRIKRILEGWVPLLPFQRPQENFAQAGGDRTHDRLNTERQLLFHFLQAGVDQLARKINIGAFLKNDGDLRQPVAGNRPGFEQVGQSRQCGFHRVGDALFHFQWRVAGRFRVDLHLNVGDVRQSVDRQALKAVDAETDQAECRKQHEHSLPD